MVLTGFYRAVSCVVRVLCSVLCLTGVSGWWLTDYSVAPVGADLSFGLFGQVDIANF